LNILLIGKTGQLGGSILAKPRGHRIIAPDRNELDIESSESYSQAIHTYRPEVIINTAAFHNVPQCEVEPLRAFAVNCMAVYDLAAVCRKEDVRFVSISTDYVFGGDRCTPYHEDDLPRPIQMYGISKLAGEYAALAAAPAHTLIIRTCGLYGKEGATSKGGNFVDKRIADAACCKELKMGRDQTVSPTYTDDLAQAVLKLIEHSSRAHGIFHLVNEGECTWFDFTKAIYDLMGFDVTVIPVDRRGLSGEMRRPLYSVLANTKARKLGIVLPNWREALERYLSRK